MWFGVSFSNRTFTAHRRVRVDFLRKFYIIFPMRSVFLKLRIIFFLLFICIPNTQAFFEIVEVFPNTVDDKNLEYIVLKNISLERQSLAGYILADKKKEYHISEDLYLDVWEEKKFPRLETKIVLNNTNEEIKIISPEWELIHEITYKDSVKWVFLSFWTWSINDWDRDQGSIISDEIPLEIISDEAILPDADISKQKEEEPFKENLKTYETPGVVISLQRASYITQSGSSNEYTCDSDREECKVNFDLRNSFNQDLPERDYICRIDFWFSWYEDQKDRCNPNTIIFPEWKHEVRITVTHEDDVTVYSEKKIYVENILKSYEELDESWDEKDVWITIQKAQSDLHQMQEESYTQQQQELEVKNILEIPDIVLWLQRPSYIEYLEDENTYICDSERDECKVNFDLRASFQDDFLERNYRCEIDFWFSWFEDQEEKCNPNTIVFPEWIFDIRLRIFHENNDAIFAQKIIRIKNKKQESLPQNNLDSNSGDSVTHSHFGEKTSEIQISSPKVIVQSGLRWTNRYYHCSKKLCRINLNYEKNHKDERCLWSFGWWKASSNSTRERCNPGYVLYEQWIYELSLKVYEKDNKTNYRKHIFYVYNNDVSLDYKESYVDNKNYWEGLDKEKNMWRMSEDLNSSTQIILQGKIWKEKIILWENSLECRWVEKCYMNFNSEIPSSLKNIEFQWTSNGTVFSQKENPKWIWLSEWKHKVVLEVMKDEIVISEKIYYVVVSSNEYDKNNDETKDQGPQNISWTVEKKLSKTALKKIFTQNFRILKYDGLKISGKAPIGSKIELYLDWEKVLDWVWDQSWKYRIVTQKLWVWKYIFDTRIIYENGEELFIEKSWEFEFWVEDIENWISELELQKQNKKASLKKIFTQNFLVLKYDGLRISGKAPVWSRVEIYRWGKKLLSWIANEKWRYRIVSKNFSAGNYSFDTKIIYPDGRVLFIPESWEFELFTSKMWNWFTTKNKKISKKSSSLTLPKLIFETYAWNTDELKEEGMPIYRKIVMTAWVALIFLLALLSLILKNISLAKVFLLESQKISFSVRQKVCILV